MGYKVLGFDASGPVVTIGYIEDGQKLGELAVRGSKLAGAHLVEWIDHLVNIFGPPDGLAVGVGPGSFTGVRIAVTAAKALAFGWQIPVVGVSSLAAWAMAVPDKRVVVTSERRGPAFYVGYYWTGGGRAQAIMPDVGVSGVLPDCFPVSEDVVVLGPVAEDPVALWQIGPRAHADSRHTISGVDVALLGWPGLQWGSSDDPVTLAPSYLRPPAISGVTEVSHGDS